MNTRIEIEFAVEVAEGLTEEQLTPIKREISDILRSAIRPIEGVARVGIVKFSGNSVPDRFDEDAAIIGRRRVSFGTVIPEDMPDDTDREEDDDEDEGAEWRDTDDSSGELRDSASENYITAVPVDVINSGKFWRPR